MHLYPTEGPDLFEMSQSCLFFPDSSLALLRKAQEGMASEAGGTVPRAPGAELAVLGSVCVSSCEFQRAGLGS